MRSYSTLEINSPINNFVIYNKGNIIFINSQIDELVIGDDFNTLNITSKGKLSKIILKGSHNRIILKNSQNKNNLKIFDKGVNNSINQEEESKSYPNLCNSNNNNNLNKKKKRQNDTLNNIMNLLSHTEPMTRNEMNGMSLLMNRLENNNNFYHNNNYSDNNEKKKFENLRKQLILELDEFQYKNINKFINKNSFDDSCSICLEKYKITDIIKELPCQHFFHKKCLLQWLNKSDFCPLCKTDLKKEISLRKEELEKHTK